MLLLVLEGEKKSEKLRSLWLILSKCQACQDHPFTRIWALPLMRLVHKNPATKILPIILQLYTSINWTEGRSTAHCLFSFAEQPHWPTLRTTRISCLKWDILYICDIDWNVRCLLWSGIGAHSQYWVNPSVVHSQAYLLTNVNQIVIAAQIILRNVKLNIYIYFHHNRREYDRILDHLYFDEQMR